MGAAPTVPSLAGVNERSVFRLSAREIGAFHEHGDTRARDSEPFGDVRRDNKLGPIDPHLEH